MKVKVAQLILGKTRSLCVVSREVKRDSRGDANPENFSFFLLSLSQLCRGGFVFSRQRGDMQLLYHWGHAALQTMSKSTNEPSCR